MDSGMTGGVNLNTLVSSFFNEYVFSEAKMNINYIRSYMNQNFPHTTVYYELLDLIETKTLADITSEVLQLKFESLGKSEAETSKLLGRIMEFKSYSKVQIQPFIEALRQICYKGYIDNVTSKVGNNSVEFIERMKKFDYKSNFSETLSLKGFSELDITDLVERYSAEGYRSRYDFINESFSVGGYIPGQIVQVVAAPSCFIGETPVKVKVKKTGKYKRVAMVNLVNNSDDYLVETYDEDTKKFYYDKFTCSLTKHVEYVITITDNQGFSYTCTPEHLWLTKTRGWVEASQLNWGDKIVGMDGYVESIYTHARSCDVYDIQVTTCKNNHTFRLSNGAVVHNCGKSLFLQGECVNFVKQKKRCHYLTLGDLNELDMAIRLTCMMSGYSKARVENNIIELYNLYKSKFEQYLSMTVVPSGIIKASEYVDWILKCGQDFDVLFIDYDSNFDKSDGALSSYDYGGQLYDCLTKLSRAGKLVFVASQPKICYFGEELLPLEAAGESSRKQHISDMIITIGRNWQSKTKIGKINIAKSRRGENATQPYIGTTDGLFFPCSEILYQRFLNSAQKWNYTYDELAGMDLLANTTGEAETAAEQKSISDILKEQIA